MNGDRAWAQVQAWDKPALSQVLSPDIALLLVHRHPMALAAKSPFPIRGGITAFYSGRKYPTGAAIQSGPLHREYGVQLLALTGTSF